MTEHKQVEVEVFDVENRVTRRFACDEKLATLLFDLNQIGAETIFSCQDFDGNGMVQIGFKKTVPNPILRHALLMVGVAYPEWHIGVGTNDTFDVIFYVSEKEMIPPRVHYRFSKLEHRLV